MDQSPFFRWVWRFNAVVLAVLLVTAMWALVPIVFRPEVERTIDRTIAAARPPDQQKPLYEWRLHSFRGDGRDGVIALQVPSDESHYGFSSGKARSRTVNYLFVDAATGTTRWLFPTHAQEIVNTDELSKYGLAEATIAIAYDVIAGNPFERKPGEKKTYQAYVSTPDGTNLTKFLEGLDAPVNVVVVDQDRLFAMAQSNSKPLAVTISLTDFTTVMQKDLSEVIPQ